MTVKTLKDTIIAKLIEDGMGWDIVSSKTLDVPYDIKEDIHHILVKKLDYVLRRKIPVQRKIMAASRDLDLFDGSGELFINVYDPAKPSSVMFSNRYTEIAGVCYNPLTKSTILISYERWLLRCKGYGCNRTINNSIIRIFPEKAIRCNNCSLVYCDKCVIERNNEGGFDCTSHS